MLFKSRKAIGVAFMRCMIALLLTNATLFTYRDYAYADIAADDSRDVYTGNGSTTVFSFSFKILTSANIAVYQANTLKTLTTHYTLTGVGADAGGTVVFVTAPANGEQVLLLRSQPISQATSYIDGAISATTIERDFDRQTSVNQQQQEEINRGLKYPRTITPSAALTELPVPVASKCIGYDGAGTALALNDCGGSGGGSSFTTSAGLAGLLTDETGTGAAVFADSPTLTTKLTVPRIDLTTCQELTGAGSPEGVVAAPVCSTYRRTDGGASTTFYAKETGTTTSSGWVPHGNPAGSGAPTTVPFITTVADGGVSAEFALGSLATGLLRNTTTTGIPTIATACTHYLDPTCVLVNSNLPTTLTGRTLDNSNTITGWDTLFTLQDNSDPTKQGRFELSGLTTALTRVWTMPDATTHLLAGSHFAGTHTGRMLRDGVASYKVCRDNFAATTSPGVTDDSAANYCVGSLYVDTTNDTVWTAADVTPGAPVWIQSGVATTPALQAVSDVGRTINNATSFATSFRAGGPSSYVAVYDDASLGPQIVCVVGDVENDCDYTRNLATDKSLIVQGAGSELEKLTAAGVHTYSNAGKPRKSIFFGAGALSTDGTQCAAPAEVTPVASGPKVWSVLCADNSASVMMGSVRMPDSWDGGTVTFTHVYQQTAADTGALNGDIACQARSNGEAPSSTYGTAIAIDDAAVVGGGSNDMTTSAAVTCAGTGLAGGDMLYWKYILDATGTTTAVGTLHHLGFNMEYTVNSRSD